mmetsp:Transcript_22513/g.64861  ORF Transcript_22513/g.64861 Transcript_22513/m.64861 type:complete len:210 (-) Transcript_22513:1119-1748(-)
MGIQEGFSAFGTLPTWMSAVKRQTGSGFGVPELGRKSTSPTFGMSDFWRPLRPRPTTSPAFGLLCGRWCISQETTQPLRENFPPPSADPMASRCPTSTDPCAMRPVTTSPTPLILKTPVIGMRRGSATARSGGSNSFSAAASVRRARPPSAGAQPLHQGIFSEGRSRFSPVQAASGTKGTCDSAASLCQPTSVSIFFVAATASSKRSWL